MTTAGVADRPDLGGPVRYLWWLARCQLGRVVLGASYGSAWMITLALPPYLLSKAIDEGLRVKDSGALLYWVGALLVVGILNAGLAIGRHRTMTRVRLDANFRITRLVVDHVTRLGADLSRRVSAGEVVTIGFGDVNTISTALTVTGPGVGAVIAYSVIGALLWNVSGLLAVVVLLGVPVLAVLVGPLLKRLLGVQTTYRQAQGALSERLVDIVQGLRVLNAFGGKAAYAEHYRTDSLKVRDHGFRVAGVTSWIDALAIGLPTVFVAGVTWLAARMAVEGSISVGQLVAVYGYAAILVVPVIQFIEGADQISRAVVSARRLLRLLNLAPDHEAVARLAGRPRGRPSCTTSTPACASSQAASPPSSARTLSRLPRCSTVSLALRPRRRPGAGRHLEKSLPTTCTRVSSWPTTTRRCSPDRCGRCSRAAPTPATPPSPRPSMQHVLRTSSTSCARAWRRGSSRAGRTSQVGNASGCAWPGPSWLPQRSSWRSSPPQRSTLTPRQ